MNGFSGGVWRAVFAGADPLASVSAPEGRFHHDGQRAIYASLSPEGCRVAIKRYLRPDDPPRLIHPLRLDAARVIDLSGAPDLSIVWQDLRPQGPSPTWATSDRLRAEGWQAMLYASRTRPELTHIVIFTPDAGILRVLGPAIAF